MLRDFSRSQLVVLGLRWLSALCAGLVLCALFAASASAQDGGSGLESLSSDDQRRFEKLFDECIEAYDGGKYSKAGQLCGDAAGITPHPGTFYVRARIADKENRCAEAVELYRVVLDTPAAGPAEAKFLGEYSSLATEYANALGDCTARFTVTCENADAVIVTSTEIAQGCPTEISGVPGEQNVVAVAAGLGPVTRSVSGVAGRATEIPFEALPPRADAGAAVAVECPKFSEPTVVSVNNDIVGLCPDTLSLPPGRHRLDARDASGLTGAAMVDATGDAEQRVTIAPFRSVTFECADDDVGVRLDHDLVSFNSSCGDLAAGAPRDMPEGDYVFALSGAGKTFDLPVTIEGDGSVRIESLDNQPVVYEVVCADSGSEPPVYVRVDEKVGTCPMTGTVAIGTYEVEARRDGYDDWSTDLQISHESSRIEVPELDASTFWTPGVITAIARRRGHRRSDLRRSRRAEHARRVPHAARWL